MISPALLFLILRSLLPDDMPSRIASLFPAGLLLVFIALERDGHFVDERGNRIWRDSDFD